jgi:hypothetical protein
MDARLSSRSLILVLLMLFAAFTPALSPYEPQEKVILEEEESTMHTSSGPQMVLNIENKLGFGSSNIDRNHGFVSGPNGSSYVIGEFQGTLTFGTYSLSSSGSYFDGYVAKMNNQGNWEWAVKLGGTSTDRTYGLAVDSSGDAFVTGNFYGTCYFYDKTGQSSGSLTSAGSADLYVAKLKHDASDWHWMAKIGSSGTSEGGNDIVLDNWGDAYISGYIGDNSSIWDKGNTYWNSSYTNGGQDAFVGKISSSGNWQWVQTGGSSANDAAIRLDYAGNGSVVIGGSYRGQATFGNTNLSHWQDKEAFVAKVDSNGWIFAKGGTGNGDNQVSSVKVDSSGDIYYMTKFTGNLTMSTGFSSTYSSTAVVGKISGSSFQYLWHNTTSSTGAVNPINLALTANGDLAVVGDYDGTVYFGNGQHFTRSGTGQDGYVQGFNASNGHTKYVFTVGNGGTGDDIVVNDIVFDPGSGAATGGNSASNTLILAGYFKGTATFGTGHSLTSAGNEDGFLVKVKFAKERCYLNGLDYNTASEWVLCSGGDSNSNSGSAAGMISEGVVVDSSGNSYFTGWFTGTTVFGSTILTSSGASDIFIAKFNSNSALQWVVTAGGDGIDESNAIALHHGSNQIYITGSFRGTADFGTTTLNSGGTNIKSIFVAKLSSSGSWQWAKSAGSSYGDQGFDIVVDSSGYAYVTGTFQSPAASSATFGSHSITSAGANDVFVAKISPGGSWGCAARAGGSNWDSAGGIALDSNGAIFVSGGFEGTATFGGNSINLTSSGQSDIFIAKISSSCTWQWAHKEGGSGDDVARDITLDSNDKIYVTGNFGGTVNFGNSSSLTSNGVEDIFVLKLNQSNSILSTSWVVKAGSVWADYGTNLAVDQNGYVYVNGHFQSTATFTSTNVLTSIGSYDIFLAQISNTGSWVWATRAGSTGMDTASALDLDSSGSNAFLGARVGTGTAVIKYQNFTCQDECALFIKTPVSIPLTINTESLPNAEVGTGYSFIVNASGGTGNYTWTMASGGSLPAGLSITNWGLISGTPTAAGTYQVTLQVTDGTSTVSKNLSLLVNAASSPAIFNSTPDWSSSNSELTYSLAWGDVDGDGDLDLAVGNWEGNNEIYLNSGTALATTPAWTSSNSLKTNIIAWGDVDGDGDLDLAVANQENNEVYLNTGTTLATTPAWTSNNSLYSKSIAWGDVDGDGDLDLAVGNWGGNNEIYINNGTILATDPGWTSSNSFSTKSVAWGDVDGDGDLDLAVGNYGINENEVYLNSGTILATTSAWTSSNSANTNSIAWGDVDGDGDLDLALGNHDGKNEIYLNTGTALASTSSWTSSNTQNTESIAWGDADGDGDLDLAVGNNGDNEVYLNTGTALATTPEWTEPQGSRYSRSIAWGDMDGDGDLDLVEGNVNTNKNEVYLNQLDDGGAGADGLPDIDIGGPSDYQISSDKLTLIYESGYSLVDGNVTYTVDFDPEITLEYDAAMDQAVEYSIFEYTEFGWGQTLNDWVYSGDSVILSEEQDFTEGCWRIDVTLWEDDGENAAYTVEIDNLNMNILSIGLDSCDHDDSSGADDYGEITVTLSYNESNEELEFWLSASEITPNAYYNISWNFFEDAFGDPSYVSGNSGFVTSSDSWADSWEYSLDSPLFGNGGVSLGDTVCFSAALYLGAIDDSIFSEDDGPFDEECITITEGTSGNLSSTPFWQSEETDTLRSMQWGDLDNDGDLDLVGGTSNGDILVYFNDEGDLELDERISVATNGGNALIELADFDNDGDLDIGVAIWSEGAAIYSNDGDGEFTINQWIGSQDGPGELYSSISFADVNGDGYLDLFLTRWSSTDRLFLNLDGIFSSTPSWQGTSAKNGRESAWADFDDDGDLDLAVANEDGGIEVYHNTGDSLPQSASWTTNDDASAWHVDWIDYDSDGDLDLIVGRNGKNYVYENLPGSYDSTSDSQLDPVESELNDIVSRTWHMSFGDVDGDGDVDVVTTGDSGHNTNLFLNDGEDDPGMTTMWEHDGDGIVVALGDIDGDGDLDLAIGAYENQGTKIFLNDWDNGGAGSDGLPDLEGSDDTGSDEPDGCQLPDNTVSLWDDGVDRLYILYNFNFVLNSFEIDPVPSRWDNYEGDTIVGGEWFDAGQNSGLGGAAGLIIGYTNSTAGTFDGTCGTLLVIELDMNPGDQFPNNLSWDFDDMAGFFDGSSTKMSVTFQEWSDPPSLYSEMTWDAGNQEFDVHVDIYDLDTSETYNFDWELWVFEGQQITSGSSTIGSGTPSPAEMVYSFQDSDYSFNNGTDYCFWMQLELGGNDLVSDEVCARFPGSGDNGGDNNSWEFYNYCYFDAVRMNSNDEDGLFWCGEDQADAMNNELWWYWCEGTPEGAYQCTDDYGHGNQPDNGTGNQSQQEPNPTLNVEFREESVECDDDNWPTRCVDDIIWVQEIEIELTDSWIGYNHAFSIKLYDSDDNTLYSYFSPIDDDDGWKVIGDDYTTPEVAIRIERIDFDAAHLEFWQGSTRYVTWDNGDTDEFLIFEAGEYCVEISLGYQINSTDTPMGSVKNLFDKEVFCGTFEHDAFEGIIWDGMEEEEKGLVDRLTANPIVSKILDFMESTTGQIVSILLGILAFAGRMVLARGQRAKNKRVRKFAQRIRKAETVGRLKIIEQDVDKANDKNKLPRGGYGDLMEQIEARLEKLGFDGNPQDGGTSGDWSSDDDANEWQDDFQQAADMMWETQDMMADAREDASMARQAIEDMQQQLGLEGRYGSEPEPEKKHYERTGLRLSDTSKSAGPSLPSSKFGGDGAPRADDLVSSILSKNIAPKDPCHCGSKKMYKDCHMKRDKARRGRR